MKLVKLEVLANGCVAVDDTRITDRSTKPWGGYESVTVFSVETPQHLVVKTLIDNGYATKHIDTEPYLTQLREYNEKTV